jgi:hypothetical protein
VLIELLDDDERITAPASGKANSESGSEMSTDVSSTIRIVGSAAAAPAESMDGRRRSKQIGHGTPTGSGTAPRHVFRLEALKDGRAGVRIGHRGP